MDHHISYHWLKSLFNKPKQCRFKLCLGLVASWSAVSLSIPTDHPQFIGLGADCSCHQPHVNQGSNARYDEVKDQLAAADVLIGISSTVITPPGPGELSVTVGIIRTWTQSVTQQETLDIRAANESSAKFSQSRRRPLQVISSVLIVS